MRRAHIERLLPASFQRSAAPGGVLCALLAVMEALHAPAEAVLSTVDDLATPYRSPDVLVPFLVRWVAWEHVTEDPVCGPAGGSLVPVGRLRDLVAGAAGLAARRGTASGLVDLLGVLFGTTGFVVEEPADRPFHLVVRVPAGAVDRLDLVRRVVEAEKPAATTSEVIPETPQP